MKTFVEERIRKLERALSHLKKAQASEGQYVIRRWVVVWRGTVDQLCREIGNRGMA
jgi:hypothetical protein